MHDDARDEGVRMTQGKRWLAYRSRAPSAGSRFKDTSSSISVTSGSHCSTVEVQGQSFTEHVVSCVCDEGRSHLARSRVVERGNRLGTIAASEGAWIIRREYEQFSGWILKDCRHGYNWKVNRGGPHAFASTRCRRGCLAGGVDAEIGNGRPRSTVASFRQYLYTYILRLYGLEGRGL